MSNVRKPTKATVTKERTIHMYAELWHASDCVLKAGIAEQRGSSWQFLSSVLLTAFTFEAYLNHVGPTIISCWSQLERLPPWGKFELLCESLDVRFESGKGQRPLQTIAALLEFRNTMAHGRSVEIKPAPTIHDVNSRLDAYLGELPLARWEQLIQTAEFAQTARDDVQATLERLHAARPQPKEGLFTSGVGLHRATVIDSPHSS